MDKLKKRILEQGIALGSDRINVDGFINHRIDTSFLDEIGEEFARRFSGVKVDKILTVEASGIAIAVSAARYFGFCSYGRRRAYGLSSSRAGADCTRH